MIFRSRRLLKLRILRRKIEGYCRRAAPIALTVRGNRNRRQQGQKKILYGHSPDDMQSRFRTSPAALVRGIDSIMGEIVVEQSGYGQSVAPELHTNCRASFR